jgi:hypothetical protein
MNNAISPPNRAMSLKVVCILPPLWRPEGLPVGVITKTRRDKSIST